MSYTETKPRGPVAAAYNSPGPIYKLPDAVGYKNHNPTLECRPSYSFGLRRGKFQDDSSPGPQYFPNPHYTRYGPDYNLKYSLYSRPQELKSWSHATPGPGAYSPEQSPTTSPRGPAYSFGARTNPRGKDGVPGPNVYSLPPLLGRTVEGNKTSAPAVTQVGRSVKGSFHEDYGQTPGPGAYSVPPPGHYKRRGPSYSIIGRSKVVGDNTQKPGPGAHSPENVNIHLRKGAGVPMGIRHSQYKVNPMPHVDE